MEKHLQIRTKDLTRDRSILFSRLRIEPSSKLAVGTYEEVADRQALKGGLKLKLEEMNAASKTGTINLVFFKYVYKVSSAHKLFWMLANTVLSANLHGDCGVWQRGA